MVGDGLQRHGRVRQLRQLGDDPAHGPERQPPRLERQRHDHVRATAHRDRLERVQLEPREVVEAVDEQRRGAPALGLAAQRVECAPALQLAVDQAGGGEPVAVVAVDRRQLVGVAPPGPLARPLPQRAREARRLQPGHGAVELGHEAARGPHEAGLAGRVGQQLEPGALDRALDQQLALQLRGRPGAVAGAAPELAEEAVEAQHARAEDRPALGELALGVLDVLEGRHDEDRLLVEAFAQTAQHLARLGGVRGTGDEPQRHAAECRYAIGCLSVSTPRRAASASAWAKRTGGSSTGASCSSQPRFGRCSQRASRS